MPTMIDPTQCDTCDETLITLKNFSVSEGMPKGQVRFLDAYRERHSVTSAARLAGIHRATVYRWRANPAFLEVMRTIEEQHYREHRAKWDAEMAERKSWRQERERARRPMRCRNLAKARAAKLRKGS